jgi:integrase
LKYQNNYAPSPEFHVAFTTDLYQALSTTYKRYRFLCATCVRHLTSRSRLFPRVWAGHASIRMTADTYGHLFRSDDGAELAAAEKAFLRG